MPDPVAMRLNAALYKSADIILLLGASPHEVDDAMVRAGFRMGPFEQQDLYGLDQDFELRKSIIMDRFPHLSNLTVSDRMVQEGKLGKKVNAGWYRYPGGNGKVEDPIVEDLVIEESYFAGIERTALSNDVVAKFLIAGVINQACHILDEQKYLSLVEVDKASAQVSALPDGIPGLMKFELASNLPDLLLSLNVMSRVDETFCKPADGLVSALDEEVTLGQYYARR